MKQLIIAEKPSVATDLAKALGVNSKINDYYEDDSTIISSALGHLVELFMPDDFDKSLKIWRLKNLPIIPESFQLKPITKTRKKFQDLKKLMKRKDVGEVVNACDAGREGELIFTYLYEAAKCQKPIKRMWMS
ncbi:MAG: toprim domain-containing protein, partial [Opitutales bacterium]